MQPNWYFFILTIFALGCGRDNHAAPQCYLSADAAARVAACLAKAENLAKHQEFVASDSLVLSALGVIDSCDERIWHYRCHYRLTMNQWYQGRRDEALQQCRQWSENACQEADSISGYYHSLLGWMYFVREEFETARPHLETAADLLETTGRQEKLPSVYNNLAPCLIRLGDYESAEHYLRAAIRLNEARRDTHRLALNFYNLGRNFNAYGQSEKALVCFQKSVALQGEPDAGYYEGVAKAFYNLKDYPKAQTAARNALEAAEMEEDPAGVALARQWLGLIEAALNRANLAIPHFQEALKTWVAIGDTTHYDFGKTNIFLGDASCALGKPNQALLYYQKAIGCFVPQINKHDPGSNPSPEQLPNEIWLMEALHGKAVAWEQLFDKSGQKDSTVLLKALESAETAALAMLHMKSLYQEDASKLNLDNYGSLRFFEKAIQLACRLAALTKNQAYWQRAFSCCQQAKAGILRDELLEKQAFYANQLPAELSQQANDLHMQVALIDRQTSATRDGRLLDSLENERFLRSRQLKKMLKQAMLHLPKQLQTPSLSINQVQQRLPQDALLLEYFVGATHLYTFAVASGRFFVVQHNLPTGFQSTCAQFRRAVSDLKWAQDSTLKAEQTYLSTASALYDALLSQALTAIPEAQQLYIVPDGSLGAIPFAALLTQRYEGSWRDTDLPLLLRRYSLSYQYSSALLQPCKYPKQPKFGFGGFGSEYRDPWSLSAPSSIQGIGNENAPLSDSSRAGLGFLNHADDEVAAIATLLGGRKWLNAEATKARFLEEGSHCGILHFALHTVPAAANDASGHYLLFSKSRQAEDNFLSTVELASMDLNAELVVLSACNSGWGRFQQGEGTMSLGRAFALAGCPASLVNLWEANDEVSKQIMIGFYKMLQTGQTKDEALRNAQLAYLEETPSASAIPFYWANFAVMGDVSALVLPDKKAWWAPIFFWE